MGQFGALTSARALRLDSFRITVHRHTNSKDTEHNKACVRRRTQLLESLSKPRRQRQRQRERHKTKDVMSGFARAQFGEINIYIDKRNMIA